VELRVHRYPAITAAPVECVAVELRDLGPGPGAWRIPLVTDDDSCYAVLGTCVGGRPPSGRVTVRVEPACHPVPASPSGPA